MYAVFCFFVFVEDHVYADQMRNGTTRENDAARGGEHKAGPRAGFKQGSSLWLLPPTLLAARPEPRPRPHLPSHTMLPRSPASLHLRSLRWPRGFSSSPTPAAAAKEGADGKIVASVVFERLPVVIPKIHPVVYAFQEFSYSRSARLSSSFAAPAVCSLGWCRPPRGVWFLPLARFRWRQQYRRQYPDDVLGKADARWHLALALCDFFVCVYVCGGHFSLMDLKCIMGYKCIIG